MSLNQYEVRNEEIEKLLNDVGQILRDVMPEGWGFALLIGKIGAGGATFYTSNVGREGMIATMREFIQKAESN
jgi:hypothetical protein